MATLAELEAALAQLRADATSSDAQLRADIAQLRKDATNGDDALRARVTALEAHVANHPTGGQHTHALSATVSGETEPA